MRKKKRGFKGTDRRVVVREVMSVMEVSLAKKREMTLATMKTNMRKKPSTQDPCEKILVFWWIQRKRVEILGNESPGSEYEDGVELASNRQEAFSDGDSQSEQGDYEGLSNKEMEDVEQPEEVEEVVGEKGEEGSDHVKDASEPEHEEKDSDDDDDYKVTGEPETKFIGFLDALHVKLESKCRGFIGE